MNPSATSRWAGYSAIFLATIVAYVPALRNGFIWDDNVYVYRNALLHDVGGLKRIWLEPTASPQYYPLVFTTFWIEHHVWGVHPLGYHLVNVLMHAGSACLLWILLRRLAVPGAWLAAGVFALHPVHVESVAWVTERKNVLSGIFYLAAFLSYLRFAGIGEAAGAGERDRRVYYFVALALFLAALLSKTITASLPAAILLVLWWKRDRLRRGDVLPLVPMFVLGAGLGLVTAWLEKHHVGAAHVPWNLSPIDRCLIAGRALWFYFGKILWPAELIFTYPRWTIDAGAAWQYVFPVAAMSATALLFLLRNRIGKGPLVAALFFGGTLFPALGFLDVYPMVFSWVADHFQYLASIGPIALAAAIATWMTRRASGPVGRVRGVVAGVVLIALGTLTFRQARIYKDLDTLWRATLAKNPESWMAHNNLADLLNARGALDEAAVHFEVSARIRPDNAMAYSGLGEVRRKQGRLEEAGALFKRTLELLPDYAPAHYGLANVLEDGGQLEAAIESYGRAGRLSPDLAAAPNSMAIVLEKLGRRDEALVQYAEALRRPNDAESRGQIHYNMALLLRDAGRDDEAIDHLQKAVIERPHYVEAQGVLAELFFAQKKYSEAVQYFSEAAALKPEDTRIRTNLAVALAKIGKIDAAVAALETLLQEWPEEIDARFTLGRLYEAKGRTEEAKGQYREVLRREPAHQEAKARLALQPTTGPG